MALLRLASIPGVVEWAGERFFTIGTRLALRGVVAAEDVSELASMNGRVGSARAFARTVRDLIDWRGQRRTFFQRAHELGELPPIAVIWGERDKVIPRRHGDALAEALEGVQVTVLEQCGHYLHHDNPTAFVEAVRTFLDDPDARPAKLRPRESPS
jgi:pimeloyl-ACP methyl ester carboxylesterase